MIGECISVGEESLLTPDKILQSALHLFECLTCESADACYGFLVYFIDECCIFFPYRRDSVVIFLELDISFELRSSFFGFPVLSFSLVQTLDGVYLPFFIAHELADLRIGPVPDYRVDILDAELPTIDDICPRWLNSRQHVPDQEVMDVLHRGPSAHNPVERLHYPHYTLFFRLRSHRSQLHIINRADKGDRLHEKREVPFRLRIMALEGSVLRSIVESPSLILQPIG